MIHRVVFDPDFGDTKFLCEPFGANERRKAGIKAGLRLFDRQQLEIAPQRLRTGFDELAADGVANRGVVVSHFEGPEALAHPGRLGWITFAAQMTRQSRHELHTALRPRTD